MVPLHSACQRIYKGAGQPGSDRLIPVNLISGFRSLNVTSPASPPPPPKRFIPLCVRDAHNLTFPQPSGLSPPSSQSTLISRRMWACLIGWVGEQYAISGTSSRINANLRYWLLWSTRTLVNEKRAAESRTLILIGTTNSRSNLW